MLKNMPSALLSSSKDHKMGVDEDEEMETDSNIRKPFSREIRPLKDNAEVSPAPVSVSKFIPRAHILNQQNSNSQRNVFNRSLS